MFDTHLPYDNLFLLFILRKLTTNMLSCSTACHSTPTHYPPLFCACCPYRYATVVSHRCTARLPSEPPPPKSCRSVPHLPYTCPNRCDATFCLSTPDHPSIDLAVYFICCIELCCLGGGGGGGTATRPSPSYLSVYLYVCAHVCVCVSFRMHRLDPYWPIVNRSDIRILSGGHTCTVVYTIIYLFVWLRVEWWCSTGDAQTPPLVIDDRYIELVILRHITQSSVVSHFRRCSGLG